MADKNRQSLIRLPLPAIIPIDAVSKANRIYRDNVLGSPPMRL